MAQAADNGFPERAAGTALPAGGSGERKGASARPRPPPVASLPPLTDGWSVWGWGGVGRWSAAAPPTDERVARRAARAGGEGRGLKGGWWGLAPPLRGPP